MRSSDESRAAVLEAIDATLAGDPIDPEYAEVAELALLLRAERPEPPAEYAARLDERAARRFASATPTRRAPARLLFAPAAGLAVAVIVAVVVATSSGGGGHPVIASSGRSSAAARSSQVPASGSPHAGSSVPPHAFSPPSAHALTQSSAAASSAAAVPVQPPSNGRKQVQSSQLSLTAPGTRIEDVAQEVFDVVGAEHGYVSSSTVTAASGPGGYAQFQLTVPSAALPAAMAQLSELHYASVVSRTDMSNDVTSQFDSASSQLAQAQALRTSLLKQLQNAVTQTQIDAIKAQLSDANANISSARATLRSLNHQISYSQISLTVNARAVAVSHSGGFTLGRAAHDAGRVLEVVAGVALIGLAVLVPVALVGALAWWIGAALRRRRREQALELA
jgi:hypothetical protein